MSKEIKNQLSNSLMNAIESRIQHPFIGTLIFSFIAINFDIIYELLISSKENLLGIDFFILKLNLNPERYQRPFCYAFIVALFGDAILFNSRRIAESFFASISNRVIECSSRISYQNRVRTLETTMSTYKDDNKFLESFIKEFIPNLVSKINEIHEKVYLVYCDTNLKKGDLIAFDRSSNKGVALNDRNSNDFSGIVESQILRNIFFIKNKFSLNDIPVDILNTRKEDNRFLVWNSLQKTYEFVSTIANGMIYLGDMTSSGLYQQLQLKNFPNGHSQSFSNVIFEELLDYNKEKLKRQYSE